MSDKRTYDIVLFGATGFTGALTAEYLAQHAPANLRWALAGRNQAKLDAVRARLLVLNPDLGEIAVLHADITEPESVRQLAQATRVVVSTVGPYIHYGEPLVAACADAGTDYLDITGEPEFVDLMWLRHHERALQTGARLIHCCGFDSMPHDLGAYFTVLQLPQDVAIKVEGFLSGKGSFSGGTYHSAVNAFGRARSTAKVALERRKRETHPPGRKTRLVAKPLRHDSSLGGWAAPLPTIDPLIVRRSAAATERYGPDFTYGHYGVAPRLAIVAGVAIGGAGVFALAQIPPMRKWLLGRVEPGQGPSADRRAKSWFKVRFVGEGGGQRVVCEVSGADPGYGETSKMLAEAAMCVALDDIAPSAGQLTTAAAMGDALIPRLQAAGITFEVLEGGTNAAHAAKEPAVQGA